MWPNILPLPYLESASSLRAEMLEFKGKENCPEEIKKCPTKGQYECNNDSECKKNKKCCFSNCNSSGEYCPYISAQHKSE
uniref:WAP domain-containing protein n=1 Tax=Laticauda laticaudata TaxID=8630 RepID=A0A8C5SDE4_LATLA